MNMSRVLYMPQAKWKAGERRAFRTASAQSDRIVPAFKIPPSGSFDIDEQRILSPTEYMRKFGNQLAESRGRRLAFIDAALIDDDRHRKAVGAHPLTELLERARISGANAAPIFSRLSSVAYLEAVSRYMQRNTDGIACFRLSIDELEEISDAVDLVDFALKVNCAPSKTVLLLDGGALEINDPDGLIQLLAIHVGRLISAGTWLNVFWSATTFPDKPKIKAGSLARFPRHDWNLFVKMVSMKSEFSVLPMFSDYMLEYPGDYNPLNVSPTAKLNYSSDDSYIVCKGKSTKVGDKYGNIFPVAAHLVSTDEMMPADFSLGDSYIHRLAAGEGKTGNASLWRWCSTDHHINVVDRQLKRLFGIHDDKPSIYKVPEQLTLV